MRALYVVLVLLAGCAPRAARVCANPPRFADAGASSRTHCLSPPYAPPPAGADGSGWSSRRCNDRSYLLVRQGSRRFEEDEFERASGGALRALSRRPTIRRATVGPCCVPERGASESEQCLLVEVDLCASTLSSLAATIQDATALTFAPETHLPITVALVGQTEPRCDPARSSCPPLPYPGGNATFTCETGRTPVGERLGSRYASLSRGTCAHDGECVVEGCSNQCVAWTMAGNTGTCETMSELTEQPTFCGCVQGRCAWFFQQ